MIRVEISRILRKAVVVEIKTCPSPVRVENSVCALISLSFIPTQRSHNKCLSVIMFSRLKDHFNAQWNDTLFIMQHLFKGLWAFTAYICITPCKLLASLHNII